MQCSYSGMKQAGSVTTGGAERLLPTPRTAEAQTAALLVTANAAVRAALPVTARARAWPRHAKSCKPRSPSSHAAPSRPPRQHHLPREAVLPHAHARQRQQPVRRAVRCLHHTHAATAATSTATAARLQPTWGRAAPPGPVRLARPARPRAALRRVARSGISTHGISTDGISTSGISTTLRLM